MAKKLKLPTLCKLPKGGKRPMLLLVKLLNLLSMLISLVCKLKILIPLNLTILGLWLAKPKVTVGKIVKLKPSSRFVFQLNDVLYLPGMKRNLVSSSKLVKQGFFFLSWWWCLCQIFPKWLTWPSSRQSLLEWWFYENFITL